MKKHNQIYTIGAPHYKAHFPFLSKFKDFKCALWSEKYGILKEVIADTHGLTQFKLKGHFVIQTVWFS